VRPEQLTELRLKLGLSPDRFAELIGVDADVINRFENDKKTIFVSRAKVKHDLEQLNYLARRRRINLGTFQGYVRAMKAILRRLESSDQETAILTQVDFDQLDGKYGQEIFVYRPKRLKGSAINTQLDWKSIEQQLIRSRVSHVVVDDFLSPKALQELRRFCLESSIWNYVDPNRSYLGSYEHHGFYCPLLEQISEELVLSLKSVFSDLQLARQWGFKYPSQSEGARLHADSDAGCLTANFWLTQDGARLRKNSGGLIIHDLRAPLKWGYKHGELSSDYARQLVREARPRRWIIPYRANRLVLFDSDLLHETARVDFRPGYTNRRINVTLTFAKSSKAQP